MHKLAIYDMDKTITRKATFGPFLQYAVPRYAPWRALLLPVVAIVTLGYAFKLIDRARLKEINLGLLLGQRIPEDKLIGLAKGFAEQTLANNVLKGALNRLTADRAEGYTPVLATASYAFYVHEIAALLGMDHVIATKATETNGFVTPKIVGENCYAAAKLKMVKAWFVVQGIDRKTAHVRFYSDHVSDAPCLEWADEAFATNPHAPLRALAAQKGWTVFDWR